MTDLCLRPFQLRDVAACVAIHQRAFPRFFLSELGPMFLREFYLAFVDQPEAVAIVGVDSGGEVRGVVVGTTAPHGFFRRLLLRRWHRFAAASLALLVRRPRAIPRLVRAVRYRGDGPGPATGALLSSICVDPQSGRGLGRPLLEAFVSAVRDRGVHSAYLTTDAHDNDRVNEFYRSAGWQLASRFETPEGRTMNCYVWRESTEGHSREAAT